MSKKSLFDRALGTELSSRFEAWSDTLGRDLTDDEVREYAQYQLEALPCGGVYEGKQLQKVMRQMRALLK